MRPKARYTWVLNVLKLAGFASWINNLEEIKI